MKKLLTLSAGIFFAAALFAQSIPNGSFTNWTTTSWLDPQYFSTSNDQNVTNGGTANVTQTAGYLGVNYGLQLETVSATQKNAGAYCIDADVNNSGTPTGGIPYNQKPTGLRFWYEYTPVSNDTAAVLVLFKNSGSVIDSFEITLSTEESSYTLHTYIPASPLPSTPDTVIFGALSSIKLLQNGGGNNLPVGSTLVIDSVKFLGGVSQPAEFDGNFKTWIKDSLLNPTGWYTQYPTASRTTDASTGSTYALELRTIDTLGSVEQGAAWTGNTNCNNGSNCTVTGGYAYAVPASGKDTLEFAYKYAPTTGDTANINLQFIKNGQPDSYYSVSLYKTNTVYKDTTLPIDLTGVNPAPDSVIVNISATSHNHDTSNAQNAPFVGTVLKIDNIYFTSSPLGVPTLSAQSGDIKVYPNPTNSQIKVDLTNLSGSLQKLAIYDMSGRMISSQSYAGGVRNSLETIDMSSFSAGIYLIEATTENGRFYQKVCKQ